MERYDVVVLGSGAAGLTTAITAYDGCATVAVFEKADQVGGTTAPVQFYAVAGMPDYHAEFPGGKPEGCRTLECPIYPLDELGEWAARVAPSPHSLILISR